MGQETDLCRELALAQAECARLREENERLKKELLSRDASHDLVHSIETRSVFDPVGTSSDTLIPNSSELKKATPVIAGQAPVTSASEPAAKITLFRKLFHGREDVYAIRWTGRNGRSGYSPAAPRDEKSGLKTADYKKRKCFP